MNECLCVLAEPNVLETFGPDHFGHQARRGMAGAMGDPI